MPRGQTPALTPQQADRYREVVRLKSAGLTFDEIADRVGYASRSGAKEAYDAALRYWGRESVDQLRTIEGERLEQLWRFTFGRILSTPETTDEFVKLVNTAVRISGQRSSLFGLDAPKQVELTGENGNPIKTDVGAMLVERIRALGYSDGYEGALDVEVTG
jgi:hypothetical protein